MRPTRAFALLLAAVVAPAAGDGRLETLFSHAAEVTVEGEGLAALSLPLDVISSCRPDLSDVRLVDGEGREVPYLVDSGVAPERSLERLERLQLEVLEVARSTETSDTAPHVRRETLRLRIPDEARSGAWELVLETGSAAFVRRVEVSELPSDDREPRSSAGSVFRLPASGLENLSVALGPLEGEKLLVDISGQEEFWLSPTPVLLRSTELAGRARLRAPLAILERSEHDGRTRLILERPRGLVADRLVVETSTATFRRAVQVHDEGPGGEGRIGSGEWIRVEAFSPAEQLEVDLARAAGDRLRVEIENGDSPPLEGLTIHAEVRQPALVFSAAAGAERLLFGGGRAHRPAYDLARLSPRLPAGGSEADLALRLRDRERLATVALGPLAPNPDFDPQPALAFAMAPGARLDPAGYSHRQVIDAEPSAEGLNRVALDVALLAHARTDLADLRVVDAFGLQRPFLLERPGTLERWSLGPEDRVTEGGSTSYELTLPVRPLPVEGLTLSTPEPFFDRDYKVFGAVDEDEEVVATGRLARQLGDVAPVTVPLPARRWASLRLEVEDGDNPPLALEQVEGSARLPALYFPAPPGRYHLLAGQADSAAPRYELERVREVVLAVSAGSAESAAVEPNPDYSPKRWGSGDFAQTALLWAAIAAAVLSLAWMTVRLSR